MGEQIAKHSIAPDTPLFQIDAKTCGSQMWCSPSTVRCGGQNASRIQYKKGLTTIHVCLTVSGLSTGARRSHGRAFWLTATQRVTSGHTWAGCRYAPFDTHNVSPFKPTFPLLFGGFSARVCSSIDIRKILEMWFRLMELSCHNGFAGLQAHVEPARHAPGAAMAGPASGLLPEVRTPTWTPSAIPVIPVFEVVTTVPCIWGRVVLI